MTCIAPLELLGWGGGGPRQRFVLERSNAFKGVLSSINGLMRPAGRANPFRSQCPPISRCLLLATFWTSWATGDAFARMPSEDPGLQFVLRYLHLKVLDIGSIHDASGGARLQGMLGSWYTTLPFIGARAALLHVFVLYLRVHGRHIRPSIRTDREGWSSGNCCDLIRRPE